MQPIGSATYTPPTPTPPEPKAWIHEPAYQRGTQPHSKGGPPATQYMPNMGGIPVPKQDSHTPRVVYPPQQVAKGKSPAGKGNHPKGGKVMVPIGYDPRTASPNPFSPQVLPQGEAGYEGIPSLADYTVGQGEGVGSSSSGLQ
eukprot:2812604-Karenia_brevis.AAC.1